jgi:hypothetical protein
VKEKVIIIGGVSLKINESAVPYQKNELLSEKGTKRIINNDLNEEIKYCLDDKLCMFKPKNKYDVPAWRRYIKTDKDTYLLDYMGLVLHKSQIYWIKPRSFMRLYNFIEFYKVKIE